METKLEFGLINCDCTLPQFDPRSVTILLAPLSGIRATDRRLERATCVTYPKLFELVRRCDAWPLLWKRPGAIREAAVPADL